MRIYGFTARAAGHKKQGNPFLRKGVLFHSFNTSIEKPLKNQENNFQPTFVCHDILK